MGNSKIKRSFKNASNKNYTPNNTYLLNISMPQAFEMFDLADHQIAQPLFEAFVVTGTVIYMMAQISISAYPENAQWVDQLPSYRDLKAVINSRTGMLVAACFGLSASFGYAMDDFEKEGEEKFNSFASLPGEMVESQAGNTKRIKPAKNSWMPYARGEMGAARGQMLSCPSTNLIKLNIIGSEVPNYDLQDCLNNLGFDKETFLKYDMSVETARKKIRNIFLTDISGRPMTSLIYDEPNFIKSKIQNEIIGDSIVRINDAKIQLEKGMEPLNAFNKSMIKKHLTKSEFFAYNIAIRTGDTPMIKKFSSIAVERSKSPKSDM